MTRRDRDTGKLSPPLVLPRWLVALVPLAACSETPPGAAAVDAGAFLPDVTYVALDVAVAGNPDVVSVKPDVAAAKLDSAAAPADVLAAPDLAPADSLAADATAAAADAAAAPADAAPTDVPAACTTTTCATAADCPESAYGTAVACQIAVCAAGCCKVAEAQEGGACADGDLCTVGEICSGGICVGAPKTCDDGNACTLDTCNPQTGACMGTAKVCASPSACQKGACDPKSGACGGETKPGFCFVQGACVSDGMAAPEDVCKYCNSLLDAGAWSAHAGNPCDDGNACTFSDKCTSEGICKGKGPPGCCTTDADCAPSSDPCKPNKCNVAAGLCAIMPKSGCCDAGACCDLASNSIAALGTPCGVTPVAIEYQCAGAAVQQRDVLPGCDGKGANGCSADPPVFGAWQTIKTCAGSSVCTPTASGAEPTCELTGIYGSCTGACGAKAKDGNCHCDASCTQMSDCCSDFVPLCGCVSGECCALTAQYPKPAGSSCTGVAAPSKYKCVTGQLWQQNAKPTCDGKNTCSAAPASLVWEDWIAQAPCAAGTTCKAADDGSIGKCLAPTCAGRCGTALAGVCLCSPFCLSFGLCCPDFIAAGCLGVTGCGGAKTCSGKCGGSGTGGCMCDADCELFGDCCPDKAVCGCG